MQVGRNGAELIAPSPMRRAASKGVKFSESNPQIANSNPQIERRNGANTPCASCIANKTMAQLRRISIDVTIVSPQQAVHENHAWNSEMPDFDVEAFIAKLDGMGMKLTAVQLADGRFRVSRWCLMKANEHTQQIQDLWSRQIGDDQERIDVLAAHLAKSAPREMTRSITSGLPQVAAPDIAQSD